MSAHLSASAVQASAVVPSTLNPLHHTLKGYTLLISGASRGIGLAFALAAAAQGANIAIIGKTATPDARLPGTIYSAAAEVEAAGGRAAPIQCDVRDEAQVDAAVRICVEKFGGIDIVINNASAISTTSTEQTTMKRYDLMHSINGRG
jgi:citronellol/citronellal dehydrogenase